MGYYKVPRSVLFLCLFISFCLPYQFLAYEVEADQPVQLLIDASEGSGRRIPDTLFGIFFEEINHAGTGGLWAELVSNRGFEAGGAIIPSNIDPWSIIGDESSLIVSTDRSSCFERNKVALRMEVLCDSEGAHICPSGGVGLYNPGFWGMGHGFRKDLVDMLTRIKPRFLRFPGMYHVTWPLQIGLDWWLAEDLDALPIWEALDGLEFARGNYLKFYDAIRRTYPDIKMITNCDGSSRPLDHPADMYDFHAFVSEYAVTGKDAGTGSLLAALAEAGFLIGLEKNSDIVQMASYAPLFVNTNDRRWNPDAIVFNSSQHYGTPSYWVQHFFAESSGATLLNAALKTNSSSLVASAITWKNSEGQSYIRIKIVNFGSTSVNLKISVSGLDPNSVELSGSTKTILTSANVMDENSFKEPEKIAPIQTLLESADKEMAVQVLPHSFTSFDLLKKSVSLRIKEDDSSSISSI
ncbi:hypothetical protein COLO4_02962 [Corchorus olitorius]|uniref:Alpha-L-arabinofuranosidase C-terminal domain-containing protein n=1 Tax=Corchorus olitorius TaxID=93759 RepID=A0A1R3KZV5_9ROSI|nr:hypothetical protein COLO4_02962 [Corchorus olitorius]